MAVYERLLYSAGGGVVFPAQQAEQAKNAAHLIIGLGGTGIDCLRTVKTQVYECLKPDDPHAAAPAYRHIRFLGVDSDTHAFGWGRGHADGSPSDGLLALDECEGFDIAYNHIPMVPPMMPWEQVVRLHPELAWFRYKEVYSGFLSGVNHGAGGVRQVGRLMLMDRSDDFVARIERELRAATDGLADPTVYVHILSGLGGGTGSGCFLDVCYLVRHVLGMIRGSSAVLGYFFLPDVNPARMPQGYGLPTYDIRANAYAALQELDYCMGIPSNGDAFEQVYKGCTKAAWDCPPVDMCHVIGATDSTGAVIENAYDHAMRVTASYIVEEALTLRTESIRDYLGDIAAFHWNCSAVSGHKTIGSNLDYCAIGGACARLPLRQMNTYLISELFVRFGGVATNAPTQADVDRLAIAAFAWGGNSIDQVFDTVYKSLLHELTEDASASYVPYAGDWRYVRNYGDRSLVESYTNQTATKLQRMETYAKMLVDAENERSLIARLRTRLDDVIRDVERGPIYAHRMLSGTQGHNLLNFIDGLIAQNAERWEWESAQANQRSDDYKQAEHEFWTANVFNVRKRFERYEHCLMLLEQHRYCLGCYEQLDHVLRTLRGQVEELESYYRTLAHVMETLRNTFRENQLALRSSACFHPAHHTTDFAQPIVTVAEIDASCDAELARTDIGDTFGRLVDLFLKNVGEWAGKDEARITRLVTGFFAEEALEAVSDRTLTAWLADKYREQADEAGAEVGGARCQDPTDAALADSIYRDWILPLAAGSRPLFGFDGLVWNDAQTWRPSLLTIPEISAPVRAAAWRLQDHDQRWEVRESAPTASIAATQLAAAFPLAAWAGLSACARDYYARNVAGRHLFEGNPIPGMAFDDWRQLPPLTPQSLLDLDEAPQQVRDLVEPARELFDEAWERGVIDRELRICGPERDDDGVLVPTGHALPRDGYCDTEDRVRNIAKDHFVSSPVLQMKVRSILHSLGYNDNVTKNDALL